LISVKKNGRRIFAGGGMGREKYAADQQADTIKNQMPKNSRILEGKKITAVDWQTKMSEYFIRPYTFDKAEKSVIMGAGLPGDKRTKKDFLGEKLADAAKKAFDLASALGYVGSDYKRLYLEPADVRAAQKDRIALMNELTFAIFLNRGEVAGEYRTSLAGARNIKEALQNLEALTLVPELAKKPIGPELVKVGRAKD
jgi:hypothetical protein